MSGFIHNKIRQALYYAGMARMVMSLALLVFMTCSFSPAPAQDDEEYNIKAAFVYKFTNYIEWGQSLPGNEFIIGVIGSSPIKDQLTEIAKNKTVKDKKIVIRQFNKLEDIGACHILFIPKKTPFPLNEILAKIAGKGTLTIAEKAGYAHKGADINFVEVDDKLKFEANPKEINAAGLKASSQLLKLAIIVD